jgi:hypothetical protein
MKMQDYTFRFVTTAGAVLAAVVGSAGLPAGAAEPTAGLAVEEIGLLPHEKEAMQIPANERNPFDLGVAIEQSEDIMEDTTLQAQKIMSKLNSFSVNGVITTDSGIQVLLADMILEEGSFVSPVIPGQTDRLKVTKIDNEEIEITWIEAEDGEGYRNPQARVFRKRLDTGAGVATVLRGSGTGPAEGGVSTHIRKKGDLQQELRTATLGGAPGEVAEPESR